MLLGFGKDAKLIRLAGGVAAGIDGSRQTLPEVDTAGYSGVAFVVMVGTVTSTGVITLRAKNSDTSATYGAGTIDDIGSAVGLTTNKFLILDVLEPRERYVRADYQRTVANVVIEAVFAVLYNANNSPVPLAAGDVLATVVGATPSAS